MFHKYVPPPTIFMRPELWWAKFKQPYQKYNFWYALIIGGQNDACRVINLWRNDDSSFSSAVAVGSETIREPPKIFKSSIFKHLSGLSTGFHSLLSRSYASYLDCSSSVIFAGTGGSCFASNASLWPLLWVEVLSNDPRMIFNQLGWGSEQMLMVDKVSEAESR